MKYVTIFASKSFMYHGTSSFFLRSILKQGLSFKEDRRLWTTEKDESNESYPGIYFANQMSTAYSSASNTIHKFKGNKLIIVAQIESQTPSIVLDEDCLTPSLFVDVRNSNILINYLLYPEILDTKAIDDLFIRTIQNRCKKVPNKINTVLPLFHSMLQKYMVYKLAMMSDSDIGYWDKSNVTLLKDKYNFDTARKDFRTIYDKFIKKVNFLTSSNGYNLFHNVRVTEPITYKGKNRILCVIEIIEPKNTDEDRTYKLKIWYNKSSEALASFKETFESFITKNYIVI